MRAYRALARSSLSKSRSPHRPSVRHQHTEPPHKYYFQKPDFVPPPPPPPFRAGPSLTVRLLRSTLYACFFCTVGGLTTNAFSTWTWLYSIFPPDSDSDKIYMSLINDKLDTHPLTVLLEKDPRWKLIEGLVMEDLDKSLRGSRGVNVRHWVNPSRGNLIFLVHFGVGTEGWPQIVHGGVLTSYMHSAMEIFSRFCFPPPRPFQEYTQAELEELLEGEYWNITQFEMAFEKPVHTGDLYCIWITPAVALGKGVLQEMGGNGTKSHMPKVSKEDFSKTMIGSIMQIDHLPHETGSGKRFERYGNAVGVFGNTKSRAYKKPVQLTLDGKLV